MHSLIKKTGFPQVAVSQHLNQMRRVGLLNARRRGEEMDPPFPTRPLSSLNGICTHCSEGDFE